MKIFLSWSGRMSHAVADLLRAWLPGVLPYVDPWLSTSDIPKGAAWSTSLSNALETAEFGIICIVPDNLDARWLNYEAGALSGRARDKVAPLLFELEPSQVSGPLAQYQMTVFNADDVLRLLRTINGRAGDRAVAATTLANAFETAWPRVEMAVRNVLMGADADGGREGASDADDYEPDEDEEDVLQLLANLPEEDGRNWIDISDLTDGLNMRTRRAEYVLHWLTLHDFLVRDDDEDGDAFWQLSAKGVQYVVEVGLVDE